MARTPEPKTQAIRDLLVKYPGLTWNPPTEGAPSAKQLLRELGYTDSNKNDKKRITENDFNVKKHLFSHAQAERRNGVARKTPKVRLASNDGVLVALQIVNKVGGLDAYRAALDSKVKRLARLQERLDSVAAQVAEMRSNVETFEQVQQAVA